MIRAKLPLRGLLALLLTSAGGACLAAAPLAVDPLTACLTADSYPPRADREKIVADCGKALDAGVADPGQHAKALVNRSLAAWRLDRNAEAEKDAEAALKLAPNDADALLARGLARMDLDRVDQAIEDFNAVLTAHPGHPFALLYRGRARQWHKDDPIGAKADYDAALATDPKFVRAYLQRADLLRGSDPASAERDLKFAMTLTADNGSIQLQMAGLYEDQSRPKEAMALYDGVVRAEPDNAYALIYRSALKRTQDDADGALGDADQAVRISPKLARAHEARAEALAMLARDDDAMNAYRDGLKVEPEHLGSLIGVGFLSRKTNHLDEGLAALNTALKISPKNTEALFDRAMVWAAKGDPKRAMEDYGALIAVKPSAAAHYNRAQLLSEAGDHEGSLADYRKAAELDPKDPDALNGVGIELGELDRGEEELKAYDAALKVDPANTAAKVNKAIYHADREDWPRAADAYRVALLGQPKRADLHVALGDCLLNLDQEAAARKEYDLAVKLDPKSEDGWRARAVLNRRVGRLRDAIADYGRALALAPENTNLLVNRAAVLSLDDRDALAMADLDAAVRLAPKSAFVLNNRGLINAEANRYDAALTDYGQAIAADADYEPAYYNRADVFISQDRFDRAIRDLNVSLRLSPGDSMTLARKGYVYSLLKDYRRALEELDAALAADPTYAQALKWRADVKALLGDAAGAEEDRSKTRPTASGR